MKTIYLLILVAICSSSLGQNCSDFISSHKSGIKFPYRFDNQSRSGLFIPGKTSEINIICQEGKDYRIHFSIASVLIEHAIISITDENGREYYTYGSKQEDAEVKNKREFLISLKNKQLTVKTNQQKIQLNADIEKLELEIQRVEQQKKSAAHATKKMFYDFTPAETMNLKVKISLPADIELKGCIAMIISNRPSEEIGF